ncbi:chloride channel protein, partial [bacterium]|nr:chloride channel protein [bacterium]
MEKEHKKSIHEFLGILVISALAGINGSVIVAIFTLTLEFITKYVTRVPRVPGFLFPIAGTLIVGFFILRYFSDTSYDGTFSYIHTVNHKQGKFSTPDTLMKIPATLLTLGCLGSGGIVGPLSRIGAGISSQICSSVLKAFKIKYYEALRTAAICGMSGIISAIFYSPIGGAFFAVEILSKKSLKYSDLFPSILAGCVAVITSRSLGQNPVFTVSTPPAANNLYILMLLPLAGVMSGAAGLLFITTFDKTQKAFKNIPFKQPLPVLIAGIIITTLLFFGGREVLGTSMPLFRSFADGKLQTLSLS